MAGRVNWLEGAVVGAVLWSFSAHDLWERRAEHAKRDDPSSSTRTTGAEDRGGPASPESFAQWGTVLLPDRITASDLPAPDALGVAVLDGADALADAPADDAVRAELARWAAPARLPLEVERLAIGATASGWRAIEFRARGAEAEVLAWLQHLLAAPGPAAGYLTDPARIVLDSLGGGRLALDLRLRIWPNASFLEEAP